MKDDTRREELGAAMVAAGEVLYVANKNWRNAVEELAAYNRATSKIRAVSDGTRDGTIGDLSAALDKLKTEGVIA